MLLDCCSSLSSVAMIIGFRFWFWFGLFFVFVGTLERGKDALRQRIPRRNNTACQRAFIVALTFPTSHYRTDACQFNYKINIFTSKSVDSRILVLSVLDINMVHAA